MNKQLRTTLLLRSLNVLLVLALISTIVAVSVLIRKSRTSVINQQLALEQNLPGEVHQAAQRIQLKEHQADIDRIQAVAPEQSGIGDLILWLEKAAVSEQVSVAIPEVTEVVQRDEAGEIVAAQGRLRSVRLKLAGQGQPENLLRYLHKIEHTPFLLQVVSFSLQTSGEVKTDSAKMFLTQTLPAGRQPTNEERTMAGTLTADLILGIKNDAT